MTTRDDNGRLRPNITLAVLATSAIAYAVSQTMVVPALPEIQRDLGVSQAQVTWVLTVYLLSASIATPIVGRLGDIYGKERMLTLTMGTFAAGLLVSALANSIELLVVGRTIQGLGGAVFPLSFGIIRDEFPREKVGTAIGLISATFGIGGGAGVVLSGVIVDHLAYEWIFWLALVVVAGSVVATKIWVPESPVRAPSRIDWGGAALLSAGLALILLALSEGNSWGWGSARIVGMLAAGAAVLALWVRFETRIDEPLVDMGMMRRRAVWTTNLTGFMVGFGMFGSFILTPQLVQAPVATGYGFGATVTEAGLFLLPSTAVMLVAGPVSGWLGTRVGSRVPLLLGTAAGALSFLSLALFHDAAWQVVFGVALLGVGIGLSLAAMANLIVEAVDATETGIATGMNTIMRMLGGSLGGQIAASIVAGHVVVGAAFPAESGFTQAFAMSGVCLAVGFVAALAIPRVRRRAGVPVPAG